MKFAISKQPLFSILALVAASLFVAQAKAVAAPQDDGEPWTELAGATPAHVRVIWWHEPTTTATVSWSTAASTTRNRVLLSEGVHPGPQAEVRGFESHRDGLYSGSAEQGGAHYHHAPLTGLTADTAYTLVVESDGVRSSALWFRTAPEDERGFTLLYGGDSRTVHPNRLRMNRLIADCVSREPEILAFVHGGDYVTDGRVWEQWRLWMSHHELCTTKDGRLLPLVPARGNHDGGPLYDEVFDDPGGAGLNYGEIQLGPSLALMTLNTNISTAGDQAVWMRAALPRLRASNRWLLLQYHRPMWPALKSASPAKPLWVPMFEENDVDLVMESDGHVVKRTVPIRNGAHDPTGVTYIGEGGLGAPMREPRRDLWYFEPPGFVAPGLHISLLDVSAEALAIRTLGPPLEFDEFLPRGARVLVGAEDSWAVLVDGELPEGWRSGAEDEASWSRARGVDWVVAERGGRDAGLARARIELPGEDLANTRDLFLSVPRGIPVRAWLDGVELAQRDPWRERRWWKARAKRYAARPLEFIELELPRAAGSGLRLLAVEVGLDPDAEPGAGPTLELLADPANLDELRSGEPRLLDEWTLSPRQLAETR